MSSQVERSQVGRRGERMDAEQQHRAAHREFIRAHHPDRGGRHNGRASTAGRCPLRAGYEVFSVVDAVGGTSPEVLRAGLERIVQAGAQPIGWVSLACERQRDWARADTVAEVVDIVLTSRLLKAT